jgi:homoserine O-acetyltransferase
MRTSTVLLVLTLACRSVFGEPAAGEQRFAELGDCPLRSGVVIEQCRIGYRLAGELNDDKSNVILVPSWYSGTSGRLMARGYAGPGDMVDTRRFFVVAVDALGNGVSSSPSNSPGQAGDAFPAFTMADVVQTQHRLLVEELGIERVYAVVGASMGAMQAYQWITLYPDFMQKAVVIEGSPWPTQYDLVLWQAWRMAEELGLGDPAQMGRASRLLASLDLLTLWTPDYVNALEPEQGQAELIEMMSAPATRAALADRHSQTLAILTNDIAAHHRGSRKAAAAAIHASVLTVVFRDDHMVNPNPAIALARQIGGPLHILDTDCGHAAPDPECDQAAVSKLVRDFLK